MGKAKKTRKFAEVKRLLNPKDIEYETSEVVYLIVNASPTYHLHVGGCCRGPKQKQKQKKDEVRHM
jgi:hypothetical protein